MGDSDDAAGGWREVAPGVSVRAGAPARVQPAAGRGADAHGAGGLGTEGFGGAAAARGSFGRLPLRRAAAILGVLVVALVVAWVVRNGVAGASAGEGVAAVVEGGPSVGPGAAADPGAAAESGAVAERGAADSEPPAQVDWWAVVEALDARRTEVLASTDPAALASYAVAGSSAWRADAAVIDQLRGQGVRPVGLTTRIIAVEDTSLATSDEGGEEPALVRVVLVDQRDGYTLEDGDGRVVGSVEPSGRRRWTVTLQRVDEPSPDPGWRVRAVDPAGG